MSNNLEDCLTSLEADRINELEADRINALRAFHFQNDTDILVGNIC